jgi:hypothetical protein
MDPMVVRVTSQLALAVYAESLAERGHVTVFGDSSLGLASTLVRLGARAVEVLDPDSGRARIESERAPSGVVVRAFSRNQPEVRDVDLVIVPDLGCFPDPADILARLRRMVGGEGAVVVAAANREAAADADATAFDYYELFDLVAAEFDCVRMIAQLPFYGVTLAELGEDGPSPAVSVDTQLAETRSPDLFVALASQRDVRLDAYSIVELPQPPQLAVEVAAVSSAEAERRCEALEAQNDELRARMADMDRLAETVTSLERELVERSQFAAELAAVVADRTERLTELTSELETARAVAEAGSMAADTVDEIARRVDLAENRAAVLEGELRHAAEHAVGRSEEHDRLEEALRERARTVRDLEAEVARRDQMIHELAGALEETAGGAQPAPEPADDMAARDKENGGLRERLDALALELARREGESQASVWQIAELERRLAQGVAGSGTASDPVGRLSAALDELDALRKALVQEHEARVRAESALGHAASPASGDAGAFGENSR